MLCKGRSDYYLIAWEGFKINGVPSNNKEGTRSLVRSTRGQANQIPEYHEEEVIGYKASVEFKKSLERMRSSRIRLGPERLDANHDALQ
ncbi:hypothetical protein B296_00017007 [Ensete ventricosum]|uniref:Uncharacterized protein n=1 Tax=Ensete ventricosum TaxID=4639 RepID=A0A427ASI1_ENSVE|nr:hypothetical protein B296_00017007 [Ensete ventricosum]